MTESAATPRRESSEGHLYMQTNEVRNAIAHYRPTGATPTARSNSSSASRPAGPVRVSLSQSADRRARLTHSRARAALSWPKVKHFCLRQTAATTASRAFL